MTSKDIIEYVENTNNITNLYKKFKTYFDLVDYWNEQFASGDLLDENQLNFAMEKLTGCYGKFIIVGNAIDAYKTNQELSYKANAFATCEGKPNVSQINELARETTKNLRSIRADFLNYAEASNKGITTCQSRLKRLSVEKGAKKIDYTGEIPIETKNNNDEIIWDE